MSGQVSGHAFEPVPGNPGECRRCGLLSSQHWRGEITEIPTPAQEQAEVNRKKWTGDAFMIGFLIGLAKNQPETTLSAALVLARNRAIAKGYKVAEL